MMAGSRLRKLVPWWARIGAKVVLARLPVPYALWKRLRLFEHGTMEQPSRALNTFVEHARTADLLTALSTTCPRLRVDGEFNVLEIGPGDSLFSAVIAKSLGASHTWLVDAGAFATTPRDGYGELAAFLTQQGYDAITENLPDSVPDILLAYDGTYLNQGVASLDDLLPASIDFCFSNAVLEHIPKGDFVELAAQLARLLKPGGVCVHRVDLKDHLGGGLNNLRFSESTWEGPLLAGSGFYTNRIRFGEMVGIFERAGFVCRLPRILRWEQLPLSRDKLDAAFRDVPDEDMRVSDFDLVLTHGGVTV